MPAAVPHRLAVLLVALAIAAPEGRAAPGAGTLDDPVIIDGFPWATAGDTTGQAATIDRYACAADLDESGPEVVFRLEVNEPGRLIAWVVGDGGDVDIDVHLLSGLTLDQGEATDCVARSNLAVEVDALAPGTYWLVVDSYVSGGAPLAGPFALHVDLIGYDVWRERPVARGVTWRQRLYPDLYGTVQTVNLLEVDLADPEVRLVPVDGDGCETVASMGARTGAAAMVNTGFFDGSCNPVGLLKIDGALLATNPGERATLGFDAAGLPILTWVPAGEDLPSATQAIGGMPMLVTAGAVNVTWESEGTGESFASARHPRTAACLGADGELKLLTFDGRTDAGGGVSLFDLADYLIGLGCVDGMNYDGGGSTTMWIAGQPFSGVVSYPSDNGVADHLGSRSVANAWAVHAAPFDHPPRFTTQPGLAAAEGVAYAYDADAMDLDVYDTLAFDLASAPTGMTVDPAFGVMAFTPGYRDGGDHTVRLTVTDGENLVPQDFTLTVTVPDRDGDGLPDTWETEHGTDPDVDDAAADPDGDGRTNAEEYALGSDPLDPLDPGAPADAGPGADAGPAADAGRPPGREGDGCGCTAAAPGAPPGLVLLLWLIGRARRRQNPRSA